MSGRFTPSLVVVTVGGDHHPFDRLMSWIGDWLVDERDRVECVVQHGPARLPAGAKGQPYIDHAELIGLMNDARAVVSSGGPATLSEARSLGHRPVTVPRLAALGEVVDDHQRAFTARLHELGLVVQAETEASFRAALTIALDTPRIISNDSNAAHFAAVDRVGDLIDATAGVASDRPRRARHARHLWDSRVKDPVVVPEQR